MRAFWSGVWGWYEFWDGLSTAIRNQFPLAWREGLALAGLTAADMTAEEQIRLNQEIAREQSFIAKFADAIEAGNKARDGRLEPFMRRADLWAAGYNRIRDLALTYAKNDPKLEWQIDAPRESCPSCRKLNGKVKRASTWRAAGVYPKAWDRLICRGGCKCSLTPTDKPLSRGPLPMLP